MVFGIWFIIINQLPIAGFAILSGIYLLTKYFSIKKENLELLDTGFRYSGRTISFTDIDTIKALKQDDSMTPDLKYNPLSNSVIYNIQLKTETIQVVGKLYKNADKFVEELASKANIKIQPMNKQ